MPLRSVFISDANSLVVFCYYQAALNALKEYSCLLWDLTAAVNCKMTWWVSVQLLCSELSKRQFQGRVSHQDINKAQEGCSDLIYVRFEPTQELKALAIL